MANTGRTNLLEEVGRIDAEHMNPNRRAEKSRVIGELNRGYKDGGGVGTSKEDKRRKRRSLPSEKKPQADKARARERAREAYKKARARKPSGRLNTDDLQRALGKTPRKRADLLSGIKDFTKRRKMLTPDLKKMIKKHTDLFKKIKESRKKLSPHQEAKHPKLRKILDQPRKKKSFSPHKEQTETVKLMSDARKHFAKKPPVKRNLGGSMGGGMNPRGWSPDPTVRSVTGYDGGGKVAGRLATRGYGKARR